MRDRIALLVVLVGVGPLATPLHADPQEREVEARRQVEALLARQNAAPAGERPTLSTLLQASPPGAKAPDEARVEVPLDAVTALEERLAALARAALRVEAPAITLGSAEYAGRVDDGALALGLTLQVTLGRESVWKTVPLAGVGVVLLGATAGGAPLAVTVKDGFHVWITRQTGPVTIKVELLVPATGPRGSAEYDFTVVPTPVTRLVCRLPRAGREPRLEPSIRSDVTLEGGDTVLRATLPTTARIHLVGLRGLAAAPEQPARLYAETRSLISIGDRGVDVFTAVRYTILQGGQKAFRLRIPAGLEVVTADGVGAFRHELERQADHGILRGETSFPIRGTYELSVHLRREHPPGGLDLGALLPRCLGVEREVGYLAVEVPGKLRLEERGHGQALPVDVRQLPAELVRSAVSPILTAYRYTGTPEGIALAATRLPEADATSGSIDWVHALTVVSTEGHLLTDLRISLRNRLRRHLALDLPAGMKVLSVLVDGRPVKASRDEAGRLVLPLGRSRGRHLLSTLRLQVVLEHRTGPLGPIGRPRLTLPRLDLPVARLTWTLFLPARNHYLDLDPGAARLSGWASWRRPPALPAAAAPVTAAPPDEEDGSAVAGEMPVRIKLPRTGHRLEITRYWVAPGERVEVAIPFARRWLRYPAATVSTLVLTCGLALLLLGLLAPTDRPWPRRLRVAAGIVLAVPAAWALWKLAGGTPVLIAAALALGWVSQRQRWLVGAPGRLAAWARDTRAELQRRLAAWREAEPDRRRRLRRVAFVVAGGLVVGIGSGVALDLLLRLVSAHVLS
jgi:hypothetical protein